MSFTKKIILPNYINNYFESIIYNIPRVKCYNKVNLYLLLTLICFFSSFTIVSCEEECLSVNRILCYECESTHNPKCKDPFNVSLREEEKDVPLNKCSGCCMKIVTKKNTPEEYVRRTCTQSIQINLFIVDHVCMEESDGQGHMCFCESDGCNKSIDIKPSTPLLISIISISYLIAANIKYYY